MSRLVTAVVAIVVLSLGAPPRSASAQTADFLANFPGTWNIEARQYNSRGQTATFQGRTEWTSAYNGRYIHERFAFTVGGQVLVGESHLGYSQGAKRFEYAQVDGFNPGMTWLTGDLSDEGTLTMESAAPVGYALRWTFRFTDDQTLFVQLFLKRDGDESWTLSSDYTYKKAES